MATLYGTKRYNYDKSCWWRLRVDYSGTSATAYVDVGPSGWSIWLRFTTGTNTFQKSANTYYASNNGASANKLGSMTISETSSTTITQTCSGSEWGGDVNASSSVTIPAQKAYYNLNIVDPNGNEPADGTAGTVQCSINSGSYSTINNEAANYYAIGTTFAYKNFSPGTGMHLSSVSGVSPSNTTGPWSLTLNSDTTVKFTSAWNTYTITVRKGTGISDITSPAWSWTGSYKTGSATYGDSFTINASCNTGYHWSGWTGTYNTSTQKYTFTVNKSVDVTANAAPNTYTVVYNANGGQGSMSNTSATYNTAFNLRSNTFTRSGFSFAGWSTSSTATTATYSNGQSVSNLTSTNGGTVTLYAVWTMLSLPSTSVSVGNILPTSVTVTPGTSGTLYYARNLPVYYRDMPIKVLADGSVWARVYYHDSQGGTILWSSASEAKNTQTTNKYSRLGTLSDNIYKDSNNKIELMLTYPTNSSTQYNRWKQTDNPCDVYTGTGQGSFVPGYEAINISWSENSWGGLERNSSSASGMEYCYIDGSVGFSNWWYAIAPTETYNGGMPGPGDIAYRQCEIWARIPNATGYSQSVTANTSVTLNGLLDESDWYFCTEIRNSVGVGYSEVVKATTPVDQAKVRIKKELPNGYKKLNYIEANGTQYIDTGVKMTTGTTIDCRFEVIDKTNDYLFGQEQNNEAMMYSGLYNANIYEYGWGAYNFPTYDFVYMTQRIENNILLTTINNTNFSLPISSTLPTSTTKIFMCNSNRYYDGRARLYFFVIKEDGIPIREFYPCQRESDSAVGLYDTVNKQFYPNLGTGTFSYGEITDWIKGKTYFKKDGKWTKAKKVYIKVGEQWKIGSNYDN